MTPGSRRAPLARMDDPLELRMDPRTGTDISAQLYSREMRGPLPARARDISVGGACIATPSPFAIKGVDRLRLDLPDGPLTLIAEGRWQKAVGRDDLVMTGISFRNPPGAAVDRLWDTVLDAGKDIARFLYLHSEIPGLGLEGAMGIAQLTRYRELRTGAALYRQGPCAAGERSIFLVERGAFSLQVRVRDAREVPIEEVGPGAVIGGMPLLAGVEYSESAIANRPSRVLEIEEHAFLHTLRQRPWLAQRLGQAVTAAYARRLHGIFERVSQQL